MLTALLHLDTSLLVWIHTHLHNPFFNWLMILVRNKWTWLPLYVFIVAFMFFNFGKRGGLWILFFIFTIALSDTVSSKVIKYSVKRPRPCHVEQVSEQLDLLVSCGGQYGFVSSHASNHFAMAAFIWLTLGRIFRRIRWPVFLWAGLIAFAQVYVGVHYPLDILAGGILGYAIGWVIAWYYKWRMGRWGVDIVAENLN